MSEHAQKLATTEKNKPPHGGFSIASIMILVAMIAIAAIFGLAVLRQYQGHVVAEQASRFEFTTFEGLSYQLEDFRGQVLVVNFWASWCVGCRDEAPELQSAWEKYKDRGVVFLGLVYADNDPNALEFIDYYGISYLNAPDINSMIHDLYNVVVLPETMVIDQNGNIVRLFIDRVTEAQLSTVIDELLASN